MSHSVSQEQWSSWRGFLLSAIGFSVGLGNIWRFPYVAGENGGSAFVIIYLVCAFAIGWPLLVSELAIGRLGRSDPPGNLLLRSGFVDHEARKDLLEPARVKVAVAHGAEVQEHAAHRFPPIQPSSEGGLDYRPSRRERVPEPR